MSGPMCAEDMAVGSDLYWPEPPLLRDGARAPTARGRLDMVMFGSPIVRFVDERGAFCSGKLAVAPGQPVSGAEARL